jgi:hypothetical protein
MRAKELDAEYGIAGVLDFLETEAEISFALPGVPESKPPAIRADLAPWPAAWHPSSWRQHPVRRIDHRNARSSVMIKGIGAAGC